MYFFFCHPRADQVRKDLKVRQDRLDPRVLVARTARMDATAKMANRYALWRRAIELQSAKLSLK